MDGLRFVCVRPDGLEDYPELAVRIRGAFGRRVSELGSPKTHSGYDLPIAFSVLFEPFAGSRGGDELPKPLSIRVQVEDRTMVVDVSLFGHACRWLDDAAEAMGAALQQGIALKANGRQRVAVQVLDIGWKRNDGLDLPTGGSRAVLALRSPLVIRTRNGLQMDPAAPFRAAPRMVRNLAHWQWVDLTEDWADLFALVDALDVRHSDLLEYRFTRNSIRQKDRDIPVHGLLGSISADGRFGRLAAYLTLAETIGIGSHVGLGLGAFDLTLYP